MEYTPRGGLFQTQETCLSAALFTWRPLRNTRVSLLTRGRHFSYAYNQYGRLAELRQLAGVRLSRMSAGRFGDVFPGEILHKDVIALHGGLCLTVYRPVYRVCHDTGWYTVGGFGTWVGGVAIR